jgi:hypothetical protein
LRAQHRHRRRRRIAAPGRGTECDPHAVTVTQAIADCHAIANRNAIADRDTVADRYADYSVVNDPIA